MQWKLNQRVRIPSQKLKKKTNHRTIETTNQRTRDKVEEIFYRRKDKEFKVMRENPSVSAKKQQKK